MTPLLLVEGASLSIGASLGELFLPALTLCLLAGLARATGRTWPGRLRAAGALGLGLWSANPALAGIQLAVALIWLIPPGHRAWPWLVRTTVLLGLALPRLEDLAPLPPPDAELVTVLSWNSDWTLTGGTRPDPGMGRLAARLGVDLLVLQEIGWRQVPDRFPGWRESLARGESWVRRVAAEAGLPHVWSDRALGGRISPYQGGVVLLSRWPLEPLFPERTGPRGPAQAFRVMTPDGPLVVQPMHLWAPPQASSATRRRGTEEALAALPGDHPALLMGDLNLLPVDRHDLPGRYGFSDAHAASSWYGGTWPAPYPIARIDAAMVRGAEVEVVRVLPPCSSDHRPLLVRLRLGEPS